ncbi:hypothetical protein lerEdw1_016646 [Lerista edwardsae]|nr:hypothetical protein lerEdw1_016646 [Lerista edwardsae]
MANFNSDELLKLFTQYALKEGSSSLLSMDGLKNLLQGNFSNLLGSISLNDLSKYVDIDKDGKVNFNDFKALLSKLQSLAGLANLAGLAGLTS